MPRSSAQRNDGESKGGRAGGEANSWQDAFGAALEQEDPASAISVLDGQKTGHAGTPRQAVKLRAAKLVRAHYDEWPASVYRTGAAFTRSENEGAQEIGLVLLAPFYAHNPPEVSAIVLKLADSDHWEVREWAASALRRIISDDFAAIFATLKDWAGHASPNVRRAVAVASGSASRDCTQEECRLLLEILAPLLEDDDLYVRKNLGAFAIGDSFLKSQPALVAEWLGRASASPRAQWNVAMALSAAEATKQFPILSVLLRQLAADERSVVRRATYRAVLNLAKRIPEEIGPLAESRATDPRRSHVHAHVHAKL